MSDEQPAPKTTEVTQRIAPLPGMGKRHKIGVAGKGQSGPNVGVVQPSVWEYILLDIALFSYVTGWVTASAFWAAGQFEAHNLTAHSSPVDVLLYVSRQALIPGAVLAMKDVSVWLYKRRQAHGLA